jgi:hypothetical protein
VHRTAQSTLLGPNSSLRVYRSDDLGGAWNLIAVIPAPTNRDIRDPHFYVDAAGCLAISAVERLPVASMRDNGVDSSSVATTSPDAGTSWTARAAIGPDMYSLWRIHADQGVFYGAAYSDGDQSVQLLRSTNGVAWSPAATIYGVGADTPRETELILGTGSMIALVPLDGTDAELPGNAGRLRTEVCTATAPYTAFDCSRELDGVRLDGAVAFGYAGRTFVIARKHLLEAADRKRTALYELTETAIIERGEFPSAGDTSYAGVTAIAGSRFLVSYYSTSPDHDVAWTSAMVEPTSIWEATIDLSLL